MHVLGRGDIFRVLKRVTLRSNSNCFWGSEKLMLDIYRVMRLQLAVIHFLTMLKSGRLEAKMDR